MADSDLSRIVNLIMENPTLIEEIKSLAQGDEKGAQAEASQTSEEVPHTEVNTHISEASDKASTQSGIGKRRRDLLLALRPYLSEGRGKAMETMASIVDILDMMKTR